MHVWSAYNSLVQPPPAAASQAVGVVGVNKAFGLPIVNAAVHEWPAFYSTGSAYKIE